MVDVDTAEACVERTVAIAEQMASQGPLAVSLTVQHMREAQDAGLDAAIDREARGQAECYASADMKEGLAAMAERRKPTF